MTVTNLDRLMTEVSFIIVSQRDEPVGRRITAPRRTLRDELHAGAADRCSTD